MWLTASADVTHTPNGWRVISPWRHYRDKGDRLCLPFFVAYPAGGVVLCVHSGAQAEMEHNAIITTSVSLIIAPIYLS